VPRYLCQSLDALDPLSNLGLKPLRKSGICAEEAANVLTAVNKLEAKGF
jgi:hypothetical protein